VAVFEVFSQQEPAGPFVHAGSVAAPDIDFARQFARNSFSRREESARLWIVPREAITEEADPDLLHPPCDHRYRQGRYYRANVDKRKRLKARVEQEAGS
jgi:phenylacetate-CoA oxygenase PaaH subunit